MLSASNALFYRWMGFGLDLILLLFAGNVRAEVFDFEDALASLGHGGDPASFYQARGLIISGTYSGIISGVSNGDPGNFKLEGTNGPASLAATSVPAAGESIELSFSNPPNTLCFDLGAATFGAQTPIPLDIQIISLLNNVQQSNQTITIQDTLDSGQGTWYPQTFSNIDEITLEAVSGGGTWAIDNVVTNNQSCTFEDDGLTFPVKTPGGKIVIIFL